MAVGLGRAGLYAIALFSVLLRAFLSSQNFQISDFFNKHPVTRNINNFQNASEINNEHCTVIGAENGVEACEDIVSFSHYAFMACSTEEQRRAWFPPGSRFSGVRTVWREPVFRYDLDTKTIEEIEMIGEGDFVNHGMAVYPLPDPNKVHLFMVSHGKNHSVVNIFVHDIRETKANLLRTVKWKFLVEPNDITPTGPFSFYASNDHKYRGGVGRWIEDKWFPWRWSGVVYCNAEDPAKLKCKESVHNGFDYANGIVYLKEKNLLLVADSRGGAIRIFNVTGEGEVSLFRTLGVGAKVDNLNPISNGNVIAAVFDNQWTIDHEASSENPCPVMAFVLDTDTFELRKLFKEDSKFKMMTGCMIDESRKVFLGSSLHLKGILRCEIDDNWKL